MKKAKKKYNSLGKIQQISWLDHNSYTHGWKNPHDLETHTLAHSVGRVSYEDDKYVQVHTNWNDLDNQIGIVMNIVKSCITKRKTLK